MHAQAIALKHVCACMYIVKELPELSILQSSHVLKYRAIEISCSFLVQFAKDNVLLHVFKPWILTGSFFFIRPASSTS